MDVTGISEMIPGDYTFKCLDCGHVHRSVFIVAEDGLTCPKCGSGYNMVSREHTRKEEDRGGSDR